MVKAVLSRVAPDGFEALRARRARAHSQRLEEAWGCSAITQKVLERVGPRVLAGPFAGLEFPPETHRRHIVPKLLGAYEAELIPFWEETLERSYNQVMVVGAAEGYYAVGLARRWPNAIVHAFDTDIWARDVIRQTARRNGVQNLMVHKACDPAWLAGNLIPGSFILSDCEGYEDILLDPDVAPSLRETDMLVELHEAQSPGLTRRLVERFEASHEEILVDSSVRHPEGYEAIAFLSEPEQQLAVDELRPAGQQWLLLKVEK